MSNFIPGLELGRLFYLEAVKPVLDTFSGSLQYSAALIGSGSEILGFDTEMSTDHHWGPRVMLFLKEDDHHLYSKAIDEMLRQKLPPRFHGYSTNFTLPDPLDNNVQLLRDVDRGPINHRIEILTIRGFFLDYLDFDIEQSISKESIQLSVPESASLDMQDAPNAFLEHRQFAPTAVARIGIGNRRSGTSPPFVKVTAATAQVIAARGYIAPVTCCDAAVTSITPIAPVIKTPTLAATTIARRNSSMSRALGRSNPQLIRPQRDQPAAVNSPDSEEGALKLETHLVNLNVSATDNAGIAIPDLKQGDFSVYEDGVKQQISFFSPEKSQFNLVLLIDLSGSMKDEIELIKETAIHFLDVIGAQDSIAVVTFTTDVTVVSHLTKDRDDLRESIDWMLAPAGGTAFYDALGYALVEEFRKVKRERNAVIATLNSAPGPSSDERRRRDAEELAQPLRLRFADCALAVDGVRDTAARAEQWQQVRLSFSGFLKQCL